MPDSVALATLAGRRISMPPYTPAPVTFEPASEEEAKVHATLEATAKFMAMKRQEEARIHPLIHRDILPQVQREIALLVMSGRMKSRVVDMVARKYQLSLEQVEVELEAMAQDLIQSKIDRLNNTDFHEMLAGDGIQQLQIIRDNEFKVYRKKTPRDVLPSERDRVDRRKGEAADRVIRTNSALLDVLGRVNRRFSPKNEQVSIVEGGEQRARQLAMILTGQAQQQGGEDFDAEIVEAEVVEAANVPNRGR